VELEALAKIAPEIKAAGGTLVMIAPQQPSFNQAIAREKKLDVPILSDPGNAVAAEYGIRHTLPEDLQAVYLKFGLDLPAHNGDDSWTLPMPARLIIDTKRVIRYAEINADYTVRPEPEETLAVLKQRPWE
jgi:peroxiredoxin